MRATIPLAAVLGVPLVLIPPSGAARAARPPAEPPARAAVRTPAQVLPMTAGLRGELARLYDHDHNAGHYRRLVVERSGAHYGRVGNRYYAVLGLWYRDSPAKNTDAGTAFTRSGPKGQWTVSMVDGAYDPCARPAPEPLMRAWGMRLAKCSGTASS
ncbi:hypothetical protein [Actinomadura roseirufa]|uniref:hypothetical protein n=1 Tax=Actinomadura roseirufa TaxID=2094049 RepID=UPI001040F783|nr:hypothetical protein [Actinomadura roseirufa]